MTEQDLRAIVRAAITRQAGREPAPPPVPLRAHASHGVFPLSRGSDDDGLCVIEPAVRCNHCGYCLSYGH
jgi:hypothetical protein